MQALLIAALMGLFGVLSRVFVPGLGFAVITSTAALWTLCTVTAVLMIESGEKRPRLRKLFAQRGAGRLYRRVIHGPSQWPRDWRMYDWALRLALAYPILLALGAWALGQPVTLGGVELIPAEPEGWRRAATLGALGVTVTLLVATPRIVAATENGFKRRFAGRSTVDRYAVWVERLAAWVTIGIIYGLPTVAATGAAGFSVGAFSFASIVAIIGALGLGGSFGVGVATMAAFIVTLTATLGGTTGEPSVVAVAVVGVAGVVSGIVLIALLRVERAGYARTAYIVFTLLCFITALGIIAAVDWQTAREGLQVFVLFLALLPLLNAVFDYLSYLITFTLLRWGYRRPHWAVVLGLADLALAAVLFLLSGAGMVVAISLANHLAGVALFPLDGLIDGIRANPQDFWWVYLMLFSTLMPTVLHMGMGAFSLGVLLPAKARAALQAGIAAEDAWAATLTPWAIGAYWTACLVVPLLLLWVLYWAFTALVFPYPFAAYLDWLQSVMAWSDVIWRNLPVASAA